MKRGVKKLALNRETLRHLQADALRRVGGASLEFGCESDSCPAACATADCGTDGCGTHTCTCCPSFHIDSGCVSCG
jgi:hypothetical protein